MGKSQDLYQKAKTLIPGGTQLLSKRPEMFLPDLWPSYYSKASGCSVWDMDNIEYLDMSYMGIGANVLGYADYDVNLAVKDAVDRSSMCTLNAPEEVELAGLLIEMNPWADKVRYAKTGGEANSIAVRIARAYTGKDVVLFCGYHGWSDWYLAANLAEDSALDGHLLQGLSPKGVPRGLTGSSLPFNYNNIQEFNQLIRQNEGKIAAVIMEPLRNNFPEEGFLEEIRKTTAEKGIVLIFDEITSGFRLTCGGAHRLLNIEPDIAVYGKAISNGYPMSAIVGKKAVMEAAQETFISSTYWTDRVGLAASIACIKKYREKQVEKHLDKVGSLVQDGWNKTAEKVGLKIHVSGIKPLGHFDFMYEDKLALKTLFTQEMLKKGYLATTAFYASYAHSMEMIERYLTDVEIVFEIIRSAISNNNVKDCLETEICHSGFQRLT